MQVLSGSFGRGYVKIRNDWLGRPKWLAMPGKFPYERVELSELADIDVLSADDKGSVVQKAAAGTAGLFLLGGAGLLAGALAAGNKRTRVVAAIFKDGRKALFECKPEELTALQAAAFH